MLMQTQYGAGGLGSAGGVDPDTAALIARMTTAPTGARITTIDNLIVALKAAGVWSKLDLFHMYAAADIQAAKLNWKGSTFTLTANGSPTFTADRGFSNGTSGNRLATGFNTASSGTNFTQNNAHAAGWVLSTGPSSGGGVYDFYDDLSGTIALTGLYGNTGGQQQISGINGGSQTPQIVSGFDGSGFMTNVRTGSNMAINYRNGTSYYTDTGASYVDSNPINIGRGPRVCMMFSLGSALTGSEINAYQNALASYKADVGA